MPKQIRDLSCSVSSFKYQLDKYLSTIPDTPCIANYDNSLENSSHTNPTISNTRATFAYYSFCDNLRLNCTSQSAVIVGCHF